MSDNPYHGLPEDQTWTAATAAEAMTLVRDGQFTISAADRMASAGSDFAEYVARILPETSGAYLVTEAPLGPGERAFSARYGVIETIRQLHQLMLGAYGLHRPAIRAWRRKDGRFIDPLRPQAFPAGFASPDDVAQARHTHLAAVRRVFQECSVFVFTLGATEAWLAPDGTVLPVPPGAIAVPTQDIAATLHNFTVADMRHDMDQFLGDLAAVNQKARVLLTVSPVPLAATLASRHVLLSNSYSKAALRVVAEETAAAHAHTEYFPAYEIIGAPHPGAHYFEPDQRTVSPAGIAQVKLAFARYVQPATADAASGENPRPA